MGIGDVRLRAWSGGCVCEKMVFPAQEAGARDSGLKENRAGEIRTELVLKSGYPFIQEEDVKGRLAGGSNTWEQILLTAPAQAPVSCARQSEEQKGRRQRRLEEAVHLREERFRALLGSCPQGNSLKRRKCCKSPGKMRRSCTPS